MILIIILVLFIVVCLLAIYYIKNTSRNMDLIFLKPDNSEFEQRKQLLLDHIEEDNKYKLKRSEINLKIGKDYYISFYNIEQNNELSVILENNPHVEILERNTMFIKIKVMEIDTIVVSIISKIYGNVEIEEIIKIFNSKNDDSKSKKEFNILKEEKEDPSRGEFKEDPMFEVLSDIEEDV